MKQRLIICALVFTMAILTAQSALAARVYNFTPITLKIAGSNPRSSSSFAVGAGQKSHSVNYPQWAKIAIEDPSLGVTYCTLFAGGNLQGGNYLVIWHVGPRVQCLICGSTHEILNTAGPGSHTSYNWHGSSRAGC
jgi:hypothetical protein